MAGCKLHASLYTSNLAPAPTVSAPPLLPPRSADASSPLPIPIPIPNPGVWSKKGDSWDELTFSKLGWTADYVMANSPRICLTLDHDVTLDDICVGNGPCVVALYSVGAKNSKCCPVYKV